MCWKRMLICVGVFLLQACNQQEKSHETGHAVVDEPKTEIGQQVKRAKDLGQESERRNEEMDHQAQELFGE